MKKIDFGQTIQILANIGVIAGIVFLAFELRQNNEALRTQATLERQNVRRAILARRQDNPAIVSATVKARRGEPLSDEELFVLEEENLLRLANWEMIVMQVLDGLLSEEAIPAAGWRWEFNERFPRLKETWESTKHMFPGEFVKYMDENIANHRRRAAFGRLPTRLRARFRNCGKSACDRKADIGADQKRPLVNGSLALSLNSLSK